jgi:probable HAF family extracellular repeat protein
LTASVQRRVIVLQVAVSFALLAEVACRSDQPVSPVVGQPGFAKTGPPAKGGLSVTSTTPSSAPRNVTLSVTVAGSGFETGSRAVWALRGDTTFSTTKIRTNSTTFVSSSQLTANITIASDAPVDQFDVQVVTLGGRKGIGIELFAVTYASVDLVAGDASRAEAINDVGQIAGRLGANFQPSRAFVWTPATPRGTSGTLTDIGTLGGTGAYSTGINNAGWVVGSTSDAAGISRAFLWTAAGGMKAFGLPVQADVAWDVNDAGQVVGTVGQRVVRWTATVATDGSVQTTDYEELPALPGAGSTIAFAINALGQAVGWSVLETNHAVLWTRTSDAWLIEDLGKPADGYVAVAEDVNDAGLVVGHTHPQQGCASAVVWTTAGGRKTGMRVLPTLGGCGAEAYGVNNQGDVVGRSANQRGYMRPTLWTVAADGTPLSVKDLGASPTATGLASNVSARIGGIAEAVGYLGSSSANAQAALWTIR